MEYKSNADRNRERDDRKYVERENRRREDEVERERRKAYYTQIMEDEEKLLNPEPSAIDDDTVTV